MMMNLTTALRGIAFLSLIAMPVAFADSTVPNSGFLGDDSVYARLTDAKADHGDKTKRWVDPSVSGGAYKSVLVDPVVLYPEPDASAEVSAETLDQIRDYLTNDLKKQIGDVGTLADAAGPGVLRLEAALTGVVVKPEGLKPRDVVPVAAVFHGLKALAGKSNQEVHVFVEAKLIDGATGDLVAAAQRSLEGKALHGKEEQLTLDDVKKSLDEAVTAAAQEVSKVLKNGAPM